MKEEDIISFSITDSEGGKTPVTVYPYQNQLIVSCLSKDFYEIFGAYVIKLPAGMTYGMFEKKQKNPFMKKLQEELAKIQWDRAKNNN